MKRMLVVLALIGGVHANTKAELEEKVRVGRGLPEKRCGRRHQIMFCFQTPSTNVSIRIDSRKKEGQGRVRIELEMKNG